MIATIVTSIAIIFVVLGALISAFAAIGLLRLKDVYSRAHAAGKSSNALPCSYSSVLSYISLVLKVMSICN